MSITLTNLAPPSPGAGTQNLAAAIASLAPSGGQNITSAMTTLATQIQQLNSANETQRQAIAENTNALIQQAGRTGQSVASQAGDFGKNLLKDTLGALPLAGLITGLFSSKPATPAPLVKYSEALPINISQSVARTAQGDQMGEASYDQYGQPRTPGIDSFLGTSAFRNFAQGPPSAPQNAFAPPASTPAFAAPPPQPANSAMNITLNVNALDSRSILDRASDIANAVRDAMLNTHRLNDVINDL